MTIRSLTRVLRALAAGLSSHPWRIGIAVSLLVLVLTTAGVAGADNYKY